MKNSHATVSESAYDIATRICAQCEQTFKTLGFARHLNSKHGGSLNGHDMRQERNDLVILIRATPDGPEKQSLRRHLIWTAWEAWWEKKSV